MQFDIELPDELGQELLKQADVQQFVQKAVEQRLLEQKIEFNGSIHQTERDFPFEALKSLRNRQTPQAISSLEHLQALRREARY